MVSPQRADSRYNISSSSRDKRFDIGDSGQQVHIAFNVGAKEPKSARHPCFKVQSPEALLELRQRVWDHYQKGDEAAPQEADKPGEENSGTFGSVAGSDGR